MLRTFCGRHNRAARHDSAGCLDIQHIGITIDHGRKRCARIQLLGNCLGIAVVTNFGGTAGTQLAGIARWQGRTKQFDAAPALRCAIATERSRPALIWVIFMNALHQMDGMQRFLRSLEAINRLPARICYFCNKWHRTCDFFKKKQSTVKALGLSLNH